MYELRITRRFKKDLKKIKKHPQAFTHTRRVIKLLQTYGVKGLSVKYKPHSLKGSYKGFLECHIKPDLLIIWLQNEETKTIKLVRIGSHAELFE